MVFTFNVSSENKIRVKINKGEEIDPIPCGCVAGPNVYIIDNADIAISQTSIPSILNGKTICLNGKLRIDRAQYAVASNFLLTGNSSIEIEDGRSLILGASNSFNACQSTMWRGIKVKSGGTLDIRGANQISNALFGIESEADGNLLITAFAGDVVFDNNYVGIYCANGSLKSAIIYNCNFIATGDLLSPPNSPPQDLIIGTVPWCGIYVKDVALVDIQSCEFENILNGIIGVNSSIYVGLSNFNTFIGNNHVNLSDDNLFEKSGNGIILKYSVQSIITSYNSFLLNNNNGITLIESNANIDENTIEDCNIGIQILKCENKKIYISSDILYNNMGIFVSELNGTMNLTIDDSGLTGQKSCKNAIRINSVPLLNIDCLIKNSDFNSTYGNGIRIDNVGKVDIKSNDIFLNPKIISSSIHDGILLNFSHHNLLDDNDITHSANTLYGQHQSNGINSQFSNDNLYCCNYLYYSNNGILFNGDADNTKLVGSYFIENQDNSLIINENTYISVQDHHANYFVEQSAPVEALHLSLDEDVKLSRFYVRNDVNDLHPDPLETPSSTVTWFVLDPPDYSEYDCVPCFKYDRVNGLWKDTTQTNLNSADTINVSSGFSSTYFNEGRSWNSKLFLYDKLSKWQELLGQNEKIDSFYSVLESSYMKSYQEVRSNLDELLELDEEIKVQLRSQEYSFDTILRNTHMIDSIIALHDEDSTEWLEARITNTNKMDSLTTIYNEYIDSIRGFKFDFANSISEGVDTLVVNATVDSLEKYITKLYLKYYIYKRDSLTYNDSVFIHNIAHLCPQYNKYAVAIARGLNSQLTDTKFYEDSLNCIPIEELLILNNMNNDRVRLLDVRPNPCLGLTNVFNSNTKNITQIYLINSEGKYFDLTNQNTNSKAFPLNLSFYPSGLYKLLVVYEDGKTSNQNIIVVKP